MAKIVKCVGNFYEFLPNTLYIYVKRAPKIRVGFLCAKSWGSKLLWVAINLHFLCFNNFAMNILKISRVIGSKLRGRYTICNCVWEQPNLRSLKCYTFFVFFQSINEYKSQIRETLNNKEKIWKHQLFLISYCFMLFISCPWN